MLGLGRKQGSIQDCQILFRMEPVGKRGMQIINKVNDDILLSVLVI